jgi:stearoyl-CoA desaturase (delta-9 desaturase)
MLEILTVLVITHITILSVTLYLHRSQAHRAVTFHPAVAHFMRFWLWITTGMVTREWVAVHRLHHQKCEGREDPHSPQTHGIWRVLFGGAWLYADATRDRAMVARLGSGTPDDWIERTVYSRHPNLGYLALLIALVTVFHGWGIVMWLAIVAWIPFWAAGVINGVGHWWGYRNTDTPDCSRNILPWGIIVGGEELHNNHHERPASAQLSRRWWEFDIGWMWIRILQSAGLAHLRTINEQGK